MSGNARITAQRKDLNTTGITESDFAGLLAKANNLTAFRKRQDDLASKRNQETKVSNEQASALLRNVRTRENEIALRRQQPGAAQLRLLSANGR